MEKLKKQLLDILEKSNDLNIFLDSIYDDLVNCLKNTDETISAEHHVIFISLVLRDIVNIHNLYEPDENTLIVRDKQANQSIQIFHDLLREYSSPNHLYNLHLYKVINSCYAELADRDKAPIKIRFDVDLILDQIETYVKQTQPSYQLLHTLTFIESMTLFNGQFKWSSNQKWMEADASHHERLAHIIKRTQEKLDDEQHFELPTLDTGDAINNVILATPHKQQYAQLLTYVCQLTTNKPTKTFLKKLAIIKKPLDVEGLDVLRAQIIEKVITYENPNFHAEKAIYDGDSFTEAQYFSEDTKRLVRGLLFTFEHPLRDADIKLLIRLLEYSENMKVVLLVNACIAILEKSQAGLNQMVMLKKRIKSKQTKKNIDKAIEKGAKALHISVDELLEMNIPDFGFE